MAFSSPPCASLPVAPTVPTVSETLRWLTGSRAYGLALSDSDTDLRSIIPPGIEDYLTLARPRDRVDQDGSDTVAFGLHHALDMIQAGGPNIIEIFADDAHILGSDELGDMILALKPFVLTTLPVNGLEGYAVGQAAIARRRPDQAGKRLMHAIRVTRMARVYRETGRLIIDCRPQRGRYLAVRQGDLNLGWRWYAQERKRLDDTPTVLPDHDPDALAEAVRPILRMALNRALSDRPA